MNKKLQIFLAQGLLLISAHAMAQTHALPTGWSLVGNDAGNDVDAVSVFGNATSPTASSSLITTVWSWDNTNGRWNFYAPSMTAAGLSTYAGSKGYGVLSTISKGDGFWVNASGNLTLNLVPSNASSGFPIMFNGISINSVAFSTDTLGCKATVTYKNVSTAALTPFLYFDIVVDGITVRQTIFTTSKLAPGATAQESKSIADSSKFLACNAFTLQFNTSASTAN